MLKIAAIFCLLLAGSAAAQSDQQEAQPEAAKRAAPAEPQLCEIKGAVFLPTGYIFNALLPDAVYSYNLTAPLVAVLEEDVKFRGQLVLPKNTKLVGSASTLHTLDRVNISWTLVVLPDGCEFPFAAIALTAEDGSAGVKGKLEEHKGSIAAHIALKSLITGAANLASAVSPIEGSVATGLANEADQTLMQEISKVKSYESVYVRERTPIRVFVMRRFIRNVPNP